MVQVWETEGTEETVDTVAWVEMMGADTQGLLGFQCPQDLSAVVHLVAEVRPYLW